MEIQQVNLHHIIYTKRAVRRLGGGALWLRNIQPAKVMLDVSAHNALHQANQPVNLLPLEHARACFRDVQDLGLEDMDTLTMVSRLARHFGAVSLRGSLSTQSQRIAMRLEENLIGQRNYIREGIIVTNK